MKKVIKVDNIDILCGYLKALELLNIKFKIEKTTELRPIFSPGSISEKVMKEIYVITVLEVWDSNE